MKGHVVTPEAVVDLMVEKLFRGRPPRPTDRVLDPGCGTGPFIQGVRRWCSKQGVAPPRIIGIDSDPRLLAEARRTVKSARVQLREADFLRTDPGEYDFVIGNPPYVGITGLTVAEREAYRKRFASASGRFDLYLLFWEQALRHLKPDGRLVFITPEKYQYVASAKPLRRLLTRQRLEEIQFLDEETFGELVTYPVVTTVVRAPPRGRTTIVPREGRAREVSLPDSGESWAPVIRGDRSPPHRGPVLEDICARISCGIATGMDDVYVLDDGRLPSALKPFAYPAISGRQLSLSTGALRVSERMLIPYRRDGELVPEKDLGPLGTYLQLYRSKLERRTCVSSGRKPWYAFHDNAPLEEILRPKILCKDITQQPNFWVDAEGTVVPRHSVYYIVPRDVGILPRLLEHLLSREATTWISANSQHATNDFLRLQSSVLRRLPIPSEFAKGRNEPALTQWSVALS